MRKIVVLYSAEEGKFNNMAIAERFAYELANEILATTTGNAISNAEKITPEIARIQFKKGSEIIMYPIKEYGLYGMKVTDVYIDDDIRHIVGDSRMFVLTQVMPSVMDDKLCKSLYSYTKPLHERVKTWKITKDGSFEFEEFIKNYKEIDGGAEHEE